MAAPQAQIGSVDIACNFGDDVVIDATGAPVLLFDTLGASPATEQRLYRLVNATARLVVDGVPLASADDPFHPGWGVGLPIHVDALWTPDLADEIQASVLNGLALDVGIASSPPPRVAFVVDPVASTVEMPISYTTLSGARLTMTVTLSVQLP